MSRGVLDQSIQLLVGIQYILHIQTIKRALCETKLDLLSFDTNDVNVNVNAEYGECHSPPHPRLTVSR